MSNHIFFWSGAAHEWADALEQIGERRYSTVCSGDVRHRYFSNAVELGAALARAAIEREAA